MLGKNICKCKQRITKLEPATIWQLKVNIKLSGGPNIVSGLSKPEINEKALNKGSNNTPNFHSASCHANAPT